MTSVREKVLAFIIAELSKIYPEWPIVQAKQDIPIEYERYMTADLMTERDIGNQEKWDLDEEKIYILGLREATVNIQAFGADSIEALSILSANLERPTIVDEFFIANIAVNDVQDVTDLTELLDGRQYHERGSLDITISYDRAAVDDPGWFDKVEITGIFSHGTASKPRPKGLLAEVNIEIEKENEDGKS